MYHYKSCGLDGIYLKNGYCESIIHGEKGVSINALDSLHEAISAYLCDLPRKLSGKEIRFLRIELDMSQSALGSLLEKSDQAIAKWEKDENDISRADDVCLRRIYMESRNQESNLSELLNRFNEIDREMQQLSYFAETNEHWNLVAV
ncbi:helix-turn-helix domain-containing protein [Granulosicoccus sp.]|nr:helix-turn-helix domain-containing protein [Granulosicoccus sp.]MDB4222282.1 helix-turn-helix domain-containing protein [Granulosicoccus sp.]